MLDDIKSWIEWNWPVLLLYSMIIFLISLLFYAVITTNKQELYIYAAWVKATGNPKELTFQEWKLLNDNNKNASSPTFVPIIIPQ